MRTRKIVGLFCIILVIAIFGGGVAYLLYRRHSKVVGNEQTQVVKFINDLNIKLLNDSSCLAYGCNYFDTRDGVLNENELDVYDITYKTPMFGYVFVEDVVVENPVLTSFSDSLIYAQSEKIIKQITSYEFYFADSEVSGVRYATNYSYKELAHGENAYEIEYEIKFDEKFIENPNYLNNIVNVKDYYDETLKEEGKEYNWTESIKRACEEINRTGGLLLFPYDNYLVSATKDVPEIIHLESDKEIVVDFCKSKLKMTGNNLGQYRMVIIKKCDNVTVKNGVLQGDRMIHDYSDPGFGQFRDSHEGGYGVNIRCATNVNIYNMEIYDFTGDAVCFSNTSGMEKNEEGKMVYVGEPTTVNIDKCVLHHCRRQGVSVLDCKAFNITNTEIYSIGQFSWAYEEDCTNEELKDVVIKGTAPSAGIDFEPDRYTFLVENALVDNCYIHNTDNFAMVNTTIPQEIKDQGYNTTTPNLVVSNTLASSSPNLKGENISQDGIFRQGVVKNSTFVFDKHLSYSGYDADGNLKQNGAIGMNGMKFIDCNIIKTHSGHMSFWTEDCEFINCTFEQNKRTLNETVGQNNGLISFVRAKLINNTFNNLIGTGQNTSTYSSHGVVFMTNTANGGGVVDGSYGNVFNNSSIYLRLNVNIENLEQTDTTHFNKCKIYAYPSSVDAVTFKNVNFKDCETKAIGGTPIVFENCNLINSGAFYYYKRTFINCYIEFENMSEKINYTDGNGNSYGVTSFGGHSYGDSQSPTLYNSTIVVKNDISHSNYDIRAFRNSYYYDNCVIIINSKYQSKQVLLKEHENRSVEIKYI